VCGGLCVGEGWGGWVREYVCMCTHVCVCVCVYVRVCVCVCILIVRTPPPGKFSLLGGFKTKNPEDEDQPWKTTQIFQKIGVVFQGVSSKSPRGRGFLTINMCVFTSMNESINDHRLLTHRFAHVFVPIVHLSQFLKNQKQKPKKCQRTKHIIWVQAHIQYIWVLQKIHRGQFICGSHVEMI